jgi:hypothetical protein
MTVRIRGIYTTALTQLCLTNDITVVQASEPIRERFDADFPVERAGASIETTSERQGLTVSGDPDVVKTLLDHVTEIGRDTLWWDASLPEHAIYTGTVTETLGSGAIVDCGDGKGFLPYRNTDDHVDTGDDIRVQVIESSPPWTDDRPVLDTTLAVRGEVLTLTRGRSQRSTTGGPAMLDLIDADPLDGWSVSWERDDAGFDILSEALATANDRAASIDAALDTDPETVPTREYDGERTVSVWFGRESRFELDTYRRDVTDTMPGHHRIKAGDRSASAAVDYVEALCDDPDTGEMEFPFEVTARQFGPQPDGSVRIDHGKPDGRLITLGRADVQRVESDGTVTVEREMSRGGEYDALGVKKASGDIAETTLKEGRWWYPTTYRDKNGESKGTYVNICTPVEVFPDSARYVDLHVDVIKHSDGTVERVDDDELDEAVAAGTVSEELADRARNVASAVADAL